MTELNERDVLDSVAATLTNEPVTVTIDILYPTLLDRLRHKYLGRPLTRTFRLKRMPASKLLRVSKLLNKIEEREAEKGSEQKIAYEFIERHTEDLCQMVAIALCDGLTPSKELVRFIMDNASPEELKDLSLTVVQQMNLLGFMTSIALLKGLNVLKTKESNEPKSGASPTNQKETIASGISSEVSANTSDGHGIMYSIK